VSRQRLSAETRREQLEQAAIVVIAGDGYAAANADAIARTAGTSKGLLWHYYTDLDDLLAHAARRALRMLEAAVAADLDITAALPELQRAAIRRAATLPATHGRELRAIRQLADNLRAPNGRPLLRESDYDPLLRRQADLLRRGQRERTPARRPRPAPARRHLPRPGRHHARPPHRAPRHRPRPLREHTATVLLDGVAEPSGRPSPQQ
jgi:AcrR family transcriptional regulator